MGKGKSAAGRILGGKVALKWLVAGILGLWCGMPASGQSFLDMLAEAVAEAAADALSESNEQSPDDEEVPADANIRAIFEKAKTAKEKTGTINFCGFYTGMSKKDAEALAAYYGLQEGEGSFEYNPETHEAYSMRFTLQGTRRITKKGDTFDELAKAVANRVGKLERTTTTDRIIVQIVFAPHLPVPLFTHYQYKSVSGVTVTLSEKLYTDSHDGIIPQGLEIRDPELFRKAIEAEGRMRKKQEEAQARREKVMASLGAGKRAGDTREIMLPGGATMEMAWCPPGSFLMGSPEDEEGRSPNETQHRVKLTKGFWIAKTEVTQKQWRSVMRSNPSCFKGDDLPVNCVNWEDCTEFCQRAGFVLPTEAQWEYACRAGSQTAYGWGNALNGDRANCNGARPCGTEEKGPCLGKPAVVGSYAPNAWGLHDMHGNVWEWCADWYETDLGMESAENPAGNSSGTNRVVRSGAFAYPARACRSAFRGGLPPSLESPSTKTLGFRPVSNVKDPFWEVIWSGCSSCVFNLLLM